MNTSEYTRIPAKAFFLLVGNDEHSWREYKSNDTHEWSIYENDGLSLMALCDFASNEVTHWSTGSWSQLKAQNIGCKSEHL